MNELSWLIYAADVAGSVKVMAGGAIFASVVGGVVSVAMDGFRYRASPHRAEVELWDQAMAQHVQYPSLYKKPSADRPKDIDQEPWKAWKAVKTPLAALSAAVAVFCLFPTSDTIYAIAASEMGEKVVKSETGGKAIQAINAWLDRQIAGKPAA